MKNNWKEVSKILSKGKVAVIPTDTLYGVVGSALSKKAVSRVYAVRGRDENKPCIVLINSFAQLEQFGVTLTKEEKRILATYWPGKISIILPVLNQKWEYLHRGTKTIAFRMVSPRYKNIHALLKKVGPLVAPSANPQGSLPALSMPEAKNYFGDTIDMYINSGKRVSLPSTLVRYVDGKLEVLREGAVSIKKD
jgi:L-threonylcarbamoyladenylate synthase